MSAGSSLLFDSALSSLAGEAVVDAPLLGRAALEVFWLPDLWLVLVVGCILTRLAGEEKSDSERFWDVPIFHGLPVGRW